MQNSIIIFVILVASSNGQELTAIIANARLPTGLTYTSTAYDNENGIYIFGGLSTIPESSIYRYDIGTDTISQVASLPMPLYAGSAITGPNGDIYYFGGKSISTKTSAVYRFNKLDLTITEVAQLPKGFSHGTAVKKSSDLSTVFLIDGTSYQCFHLSLTYCGSGNLLQIYTNPSVFVYQDQAFVFGYPNAALEMQNLSNLTATTAQTGLPEFIPSPSAVFDGNRYAYLLGGYYNSTYPTNGIIRFDSETLEHTFLPVNNFPGQDKAIFHLSSSVFVENLNRIYIFGGVSYPVGDVHNNIWYIDVSPNETI